MRRAPGFDRLQCLVDLHAIETHLAAKAQGSSVCSFRSEATCLQGCSGIRAGLRRSSRGTPVRTPRCGRRPRMSTRRRRMLRASTVNVDHGDVRSASIELEKSNAGAVRVETGAVAGVADRLQSVGLISSFNALTGRLKVSPPPSSRPTSLGGSNRWLARRSISRLDLRSSRCR